MSFKDYLCFDTIVDLEQAEKADALQELSKILCEQASVKANKKLIQEILTREEAASTFVGQGVAIPQAETTMKGEFAIIVGRSAMGVNYDAARNAKAHIIVLVVSNNKVSDEDNLELLAEVSTFFRNETVNKLIRSAEVNNVSELLREVSKDTPDEVDKKKKERKEPMLSAATTIAKDVNAKAVLIFADTKIDNEFVKFIKTRRQVIIVTSNMTRFNDENFKYDVIQAPSARGGQGAGQVKIGVLLAVSRGLLGKDDTVVCITGTPNSDNFDTAVLVNIAKEFEFFFSATRSLVPDDVQPEILERVLGIASEISVEGREGKALGTIFVVGDTNRVNANITQLIINPFRGYSETERNILDPGLEETLKEFASIDGAFVITGDGIVLSGGSYLRPMLSDEMKIEELPGGLGTRHAAAAGITACTNAIAVTVSESTGQVTVFKNGKIALTLAKPLI